MNYKTTKKEVMNGYSNVIYCGYCNLQYLLRYRNVASHTERREGWGADVYHINPNTCIVTGYAPFGTVRASYVTCQKYEKIALDMFIKRDKHNHIIQDLDTLIAQFVAEVLS